MGGTGQDTAMRFEIVEQPGAPRRIVLQGRLDAAGAERIEHAFAAALSGDAGPVLLDMAGVPFVGSLGIRLLVAGARQVSRRGGRVVLYAVQSQVMEVFETVALDQLVPIAPDEPAARGLAGA